MLLHVPYLMSSFLCSSDGLMAFPESQGVPHSCSSRYPFLMVSEPTPNYTLEIQWHNFLKLFLMCSDECVTPPVDLICA